MVDIVLFVLLIILSSLYDLSAQGKLQGKLNMKDSWKNKWKNGDEKQGEKFFGSSTIFVWLTDFFHFVKFLIILIICTILTRLLELNYYYILVFSLSWGILFELFYRLWKHTKA